VGSDGNMLSLFGIVVVVVVVVLKKNSLIKSAFCEVCF
jgi:hypothetical protein